jgi:hypothetical protein
MWYVWGKLTETKSLPPAVLTDGDGERKSLSHAHGFTHVPQIRHITTAVKKKT